MPVLLCLVPEHGSMATAFPKVSCQPLVGSFCASPLGGIAGRSIDRVLIELDQSLPVASGNELRRLESRPSGTLHRWHTIRENRPQQCPRRVKNRNDSLPNQRDVAMNSAPKKIPVEPYPPAGGVKYALIGLLVGLPLPIILILLFVRCCGF